MYDSSHPGGDGRLNEPVRVRDRLVEGDPPAREPHPVGVVQSGGTTKGANNPLVVREVQRRHRESAVSISRRTTSERLDGLAQVHQPLRDVPSSVVKRACDKAKLCHVPSLQKEIIQLQTKPFKRAT